MPETAAPAPAGLVTDTSPGGCATGECLPEELTLTEAPPLTAAEQWRAAVDAVRVASVRHGASLAFGRLVRLGQGEVGLAFPRDAGFHRATVLGAGRMLVEKALSEHFGRATRLIEEALDAAQDAPLSLAEEQAKTRADREKSLERDLRQHPAVLATLRILGGEIEHVEVFDRERPGPAEELPDEG